MAGDDRLLVVRLETPGDNGGGEDDRQRREPYGDTPQSRAQERERRIQRSREQRIRMRSRGREADDASDRVIGGEARQESRDRKPGGKSKPKAGGGAASRLSGAALQAVAARGRGAVTGVAGRAVQTAGAAGNLVGVQKGSALARVGGLAARAVAGYAVARGGAEVAGRGMDMLGIESFRDDVESLREAFQYFESTVMAQLTALQKSVGGVRQASLLLGGDPDFAPYYANFAAVDSAESQFDAFMRRQEKSERDKAFRRQTLDFMSIFSGSDDQRNRAAEGAPR